MRVKEPLSRVAMAVSPEDEIGGTTRSTFSVMPRSGVTRVATDASHR
ncbi:MAG TPA: hypothetical protein VFG27_09010 [Pseudomonadales bacterium]|nr:hypothetical protein [Pseudomonadales bacterium]